MQVRCKDVEHDYYDTDYVCEAGTDLLDMIDASKKGWIIVDDCGGFLFRDEESLRKDTETELIMYAKGIKLKAESKERWKFQSSVRPTLAKGCHQQIRAKDRTTRTDKATGRQCIKVDHDR